MSLLTDPQFAVFLKDYRYKHLEGFTELQCEFEIPEEIAQKLEDAATIIAAHFNIETEIARDACVCWCVQEHIKNTHRDLLP
jgi:hypothetical protein